MPPRKTSTKPPRRKPQHVYFFGNGRARGSGEMPGLLGGKGAGLAEMTRLGIPVPPGFTISTDVCRIFHEHNKHLPRHIHAEIEDNVSRLEKLTGRAYGTGTRPLLLSVRSGGRFSMPGMMDTVLNLGLNDESVLDLERAATSPRFAWDAYRRFIQMFGTVVLKVDKAGFGKILEAVKKKRRAVHDTDLGTTALMEVVRRYKALVLKATGSELPQAPGGQLSMAIAAIFSSWTNPRAVFYRKRFDIPDDLGTAVNVQVMVFGNLGTGSATGVGFTRDPATGAKKLYAEYLPDAQGEDVVAGVRTPLLIESLEREMPGVYRELVQTSRTLEHHFRDMQDFEFTVEEGKLYILQTRAGKRTGIAACRIAHDMVRERAITTDEALMRIEPEHMTQFLFPMFDPAAAKGHVLLTTGLAASPGAGAGVAVFDSASAQRMKESGVRCVLVRRETSPDDIHGMAAAEGVLTARGGRTSHAAVVGRQMGKVCVVGAGELDFAEDEQSFAIGEVVVRGGDPISIDGFTGRVYLGDIPVIPSEVTRVIEGKGKAQGREAYAVFSAILRWADRARRLGVRANADNPRDARIALRLGAEGIGLCRTEHMFFDKDRLPLMRGMIMTDDAQERLEFLHKLGPLQKADFKGMFREMDGRPVTIRLLDPPLHEFLPTRAQLLIKIKELKLTGAGPRKLAHTRRLLRRAEEMLEANPMLGFRGCRLGNVEPEITRMQTRAMFEAACESAAEGVRVKPEIMVPLVGMATELKAQKNIIDEVAREVFARYGRRVKYRVGTMIEVPRAAVVADEIAAEAEFFSFGTNDLTQTVFAFSRDDAVRFIRPYLAMKVAFGDREVNMLEKDPFSTIDVKGVGSFIRLALERGRSTRPGLQVGICGEHGGDPASIEFFHEVGLDYVSCSPYRLPVARLAAARAAIALKHSKK